MSYVTPSSTITVYKNVPLDNTYEHTIYFGSTANQTSYFSGLVAHTYSNYTYQRKESNVIKVDELAENLYDCNYLSFQNRGGKTFYCFITGCEYVSESCTALTFEIDVFQTYMRDYVFGTSYVVRMHSTTDSIGDNIMPEPIQTGDYMYSDETGLLAANDCALCIVVLICDVDGEAEGIVQNGVYSGAKMYAYTTGNYSAVNALLNTKSYQRAPESIVGMYMAPIACFNGTPNGEITGSGSAVTNVNIRPGITCTGNEDFDGYVPKNKKLYTYPYNACVISDRMGNELTCRFEFWNDRVPRFSTLACSIFPPQITAKPYNYAGDSGECWQQQLTLGNYPQCSWNSDAWRTYVGNGGLASDIISGVSGMASAGLGMGMANAVSSGSGGSGAASGAMAGGALSMATSAASMAANIYSARVAADVCHGSVAAGSINACAQEQNFSVYRMHVTADFARMADDYFTRYGYAQNKIMSPVLNARPCWTYIQTSGCSILPLNGMPPADAQATIKAAMDRGMTWWKSDATIGDYSQDNSI